MLLLVGLGNPGIQYSDTRHNIGFNIISSLASKFETTMTYKEKFQAEIGLSSYEGDKIMLVKPTTYMNLSGHAVSSLREYYKIPTQNIIVIHDDLDIELGRIKVKIGGGSAGHNGIKSIDSFLGNDYFRIRIGIGRPDKAFNISSWVLEKFSENENLLLKKVTQLIIDNFSIILKRDIIEINKIFMRSYGI
jgi:PTH1 family peptidyl-tRNA hydrolase